MIYFENYSYTSVLKFRNYLKLNFGAMMFYANTKVLSITIKTVGTWET